jgi:putative transposase
LPAKIAQGVLRTLDKSWISFFNAKREYARNPKKFLGPPKPPKYKDIKVGRYQVTFNIQAISKTWLQADYLKLSSLEFLTPLRLLEEIDEHGEVKYKVNPNLRDVTIVPRSDGYELIVKYLDIEAKPQVASGYCAGIDLGVNNLAAVATNNKELPAFLINGRPLKSMNVYFNKKLAQLTSEREINETRRGKKRIDKKIKKLCRKRHFKVTDYLHKTTSMIANQLVSAGVTDLVVGKNVGWKQEANMQAPVNQMFCFIPHAKFIDMLRYKWEKTGRRFQTIEESYTSKCSFLDNEPACKHESYLGRRTKRGLFKTANELKINADINGAGNITLKVFPDAWNLWSQDDRIKGFVVSPRRLTPSAPSGKPKSKKNVLHSSMV